MTKQLLHAFLNVILILLVSPFSAIRESADKIVRLETRGSGKWRAKARRKATSVWRAARMALKEQYARQ